MKNIAYVSFKIKRFQLRNKLIKNQKNERA
jgi:hypothetical protein